MTKNCSQLQPSEIFLTFDLGLASVLVSLDYELVGLDKTNSKKVQFIFKRAESIDLAINNYWQDNLKVNARTLFDNIKMLKNRIYSE
ncbi:hypothetical protein JW977_02750 [Candidatus Falkowbacteria bacterium]|nr:hypothetical protein [Candidatus Falkowbacteria bacterium]